MNFPQKILFFTLLVMTHPLFGTESWVQSNCSGGPGPGFDHKHASQIEDSVCCSEILWQRNLIIHLNMDTRTFNDQENIITMGKKSMQYPEKRLNLVIELLRIVSSNLEYNSLMKLVLNQMLSSFDAEVGLIIISGARGLQQEVSVGIKMKELGLVINKKNGSNLLNDIVSKRIPWRLDQ